MNIHTIGAALPENKVDVATIASWAGVSESFIRDKVGAETRYYLGDDETGVSLSKKAVESVLIKSDFDISDIGLLIYVTQTPDHGLPHSAALLHGELQAPQDMACFDVGLGCSGYPYALAIAKSMMRELNIENALIVTCDPYSKIMDRHNKDTIAVFGDAATATLISSQGRIRVGGFDLGTDGTKNESLILRAGRGAVPIWSIYDDSPHIKDNDIDGYRLHMNGREVFNFVMNNVPKSIEKIMRVENMSLGDIDLFALHQGSRYMLEAMAKRARIPSEKLLININKYGNTVSSSLPMLLYDIQENDPSFRGNVLISGFGVGLSWGSSMLYYK